VELQRNGFHQPRRGAHRLSRHSTGHAAPAARPPSPAQPSQGTGAVLLAAAAVLLLLLLAAAQGYVSFRAQYAFIDHAKRTHVPSILEALGLCTGAVIFALLALSLARRGQAGTTERILNIACAVGSMTMNLLAANLTSPRSVAVWVMPSVLYAFASDRLIAVVRRWVRTGQPGVWPADEGSAWRSIGGAGLWLVRLAFDPLGTLAGFRRWILAAVPAAPPMPEPADGAAGQPPGETKREALIRRYEELGPAGDPRYGNPAKTAQLAGELAAHIGYHAGTARRELARYLATKPAPGPEPEPGPALHPFTTTNAKEVA
jgi:hypothetical protein